MSSQFTACNGVKQGAIFSPILFSIYMDGLFEHLEEWRGMPHGQPLYGLHRIRR